MIAPDQKFTRSPAIVSVDMEGDTIAMSIEGGNYYGIGGVGARSWDLLETPRSLNDLTAVLCQEFEVKEAQCASDLGPFLERLLENGLIHPA